MNETWLRQAELLVISEAGQLADLLDNHEKLYRSSAVARRNSSRQLDACRIRLRAALEALKDIQEGPTESATVSDTRSRAVGSSPGS
jgi:hypothetical protein